MSNWQKSAPNWAYDAVRGYMRSFLRDFVHRWRTSREEKPAHFILIFHSQDHGVKVGHLCFDGKKWSFEYDGEYRSRDNLRPLEGFCEKSETYRSSHLFPFFEVRIPDLNRSDVKQKLGTSHASRFSKSELLRRFGRRVVSSPSLEL